MNRIALCALSLMIGLFLISCAQKSPHLPWVLKISSMGPHVGPEEILKLPGGDPISFSRLIEELAPSRVIFVGETHDQIEHHRVQEKVLLELLKRGRKVVVAMEMFQQSQQPILDRWGQGALTEGEFLREIEWETTRGIDYSFYKGILDTIKEHRLKVLGLNIPKELTRKVAQTGIESLPVEDQRRLPEMDLTDRNHRRYIRSFYKTHQEGTAKDFEYFYQAQCLWDEAMAEALADFLNSSEGEGRTVLVLAGNGHIVFDFGIPKRLHRRRSLPYRTVVLKEWKKEWDEDLCFSRAPQPLADFLWITEPTPFHSKRPRIGITLKERDGPAGIWIERVISKSPAEKAGLLPGDQILSANGKEVRELKDLHEAVTEKGWGKEMILTILREGIKTDITVILPPLED
jgi:uncharacterized iron-regulated protein